MGRLLAEDEEGEPKGESPPPATGEECMRRFSGLEDRRAWYSARSLLLVGVPGGVDHFVGDGKEKDDGTAAAAADAAALEAPEGAAAAAAAVVEEEEDDDSEEESCRACDADDDMDDERTSLLPLNTDELRPLRVLQWDRALSWRPCLRGGARPPALLCLVLTLRPSTVVAPSSSMLVTKGLLSSIVAPVPNSVVSCEAVDRAFVHTCPTTTSIDGSIDRSIHAPWIGGAPQPNPARRDPKRTQADPFTSCGCVGGFEGVKKRNRSRPTRPLLKAGTIIIIVVVVVIMQQQQAGSSNRTFPWPMQCQHAAAESSIDRDGRGRRGKDEPADLSQMRGSIDFGPKGLKRNGSTASN